MSRQLCLAFGNTMAERFEPDLDGIFDLRASAADEWMETVGRARAS